MQLLLFDFTLVIKSVARNRSIRRAQKETTLFTASEKAILAITEEVT